MKNLKITNLLFIVVTITALNACIGGSDQVTTENTTTTDSTSTESAVKNWEYGQDKDPMSEEEVKYAMTKSTNEIEFKFPYNGGSQFDLVIIKKAKETNLLLKAEKCQFIHNINGERHIKLKFDDGKIQSFNYTMPTDGRSNAIFIENASAIINRLKQSKKLKVQAEFFQAGWEMIEFNVAGLEWKV